MSRFLSSEALSAIFYIATAAMLISLYAMPGRWARTRRITAIGSIVTSAFAGYWLIASHKATAHVPLDFVANERSGSGSRMFANRGAGRSARRDSGHGRGSGQYRRERRQFMAHRGGGRAIMGEDGGSRAASHGDERQGAARWLFASFMADKPTNTAGERLQDCPDCPEMVIVPAAYFPLGAGADDPAAGPEEKPQRIGRVGRAFAIGRFEVTVAQYRAFVKATGYRPPACAGYSIETAQATQAVQCISHGDARTYARWLSDVTGRQYYLPSAGEWEHAARAGFGTRYWSGNTVSEGQPIGRSGELPPVGSAAANPFGLHDVIGSVAEIVDDCWQPNLADAPSDGSPARTLLCASRTMKDAAWSEPVALARVSARREISADRRAIGIGFRVARR